MYQPPHFREDCIEIQRRLIRAYPLGLLITAGTSGLIANPIPFLIDGEGPALGTLRCHLARVNPQWRVLTEVQECLSVFQGPQAYISPSWYATKRETGRVVPTWNYATVHVWGQPRVIEDQEWLRRQITDLTASREGGRALPWAVDDAPPEFLTAQIKGIVGVEIPISRIEGKWKMSQNRSEADRSGVVEGLNVEDHDEEMAALVAATGRS